MRGLVRAAACGLVGAVLVVGGPASRAAAEDDEPSFDKRIMQDVLGPLGLRGGPGIDYKERSPLVLFTPSARQQLESVLLQHGAQVLARPGVEIVDAQHVVTRRDEALAKLRAQKARAARNQHALTRRIFHAGCP